MHAKTNRTLPVRAALEPLEGRRLLSATVVKDISPPPVELYPGYFSGEHGPLEVTQVGELNLFSAHSEDHGYELWRTDGTAAGTYLVADLAHGEAGSYPRNFTALGDVAYFLTDDGLWRTDGSGRGTTKVQADPRTPVFFKPHGLTAFNGALYFSDADANGAARLWRSDGTAAGTQRLLLQPGFAKPSKAGYIGSLNALGDALVFAMKDTGGGQSLWRTDGTVAGTYELAPVYAFDYHLERFKDALYFFGNAGDGYRGTALWRTDGTATGTVKVRDFSADVRLPVGLGAASGNTLYFRGHDAVQGAELWKTDGTTAGTVPIKDLWTGNGASAPSAFYPEYDPPGPDAVCSCSTSIWYPDHRRANSSSPGGFFATGHGVVFSAWDGRGMWIYHTDGTPEGTVRLPTQAPEQRITGMETIGDTVYIAVVSQGWDNGAIYATDGTYAGTRPVWVAPPRGTNSIPALSASGLANINGSLFFTGYTREAGLELMRLDETGGLTGYAYEDANANGVRDGFELPLAGWRVFLDRNGDGAWSRGERFVWSERNGSYGFPAYPEGEYTVAIEPADGWTAQPPAAARVTNGRTTWRDLGASRLAAAYGTVSGNVFRDANFDGTFQPGMGDGAFAGVRVYLDLNGNGFYTSGEPSTRTDAAGAYHIDDVLPGRYRLALVDLGPGHEYPAGLDRTLLMPGGTGHSDVDFGIGYDGHNGVIHGVVFEDRDGDGRQDAGESGIPGVRVGFDTSGNGSIGREDRGTVFSDATGYYKLARLRRGPYHVKVGQLPSDWTSTTASEASPVLRAGERKLVSFGRRLPTGSISGNVFRDANANGAWDDNETGTGGWWVYADLDRDGEHDAGEPSTHTTSSGHYALYDLSSGAHLVRFVRPDATWTFTQGAPSTEVTLATGAALPGVDVGAVQKGAVAGMIHFDRDGDRSLTGDPGKPGVTVFLDLNRTGQYEAGIDRATVTDSAGRYRFDDAPIGTYLTMPVAPSGWAITTGVYNSTIVPGQTFQCTPMGVSNRMRVQVRLFALEPGTPLTQDKYLAGYTVYDDADNDGKLDEGESQAQTNSFGIALLGRVPLGQRVIRYVQRTSDPVWSAQPAFTNVTVSGDSRPPGVPMPVFFAVPATRK